MHIRSRNVDEFCGVILMKKFQKSILDAFFVKKIPKLTVRCLCWCQTVPNLTPDGHTIKEMFKFGSDRKNIGPFVRAS